MTHLSVAEFRRRRRDKCSEFLERSVAGAIEQYYLDIRKFRPNTAPFSIRYKRGTHHFNIIVPHCPERFCRRLGIYGYIEATENLE